MEELSKLNKWLVERATEENDEISKLEFTFFDKIFKSNKRKQELLEESKERLGKMKAYVEVSNKILEFIKN